jgi:rubrerythrin
VAASKSKSSSSRNHTATRGGSRSNPRKNNGRAAKALGRNRGRMQQPEPNHSRILEFLSQMLAVERGGVMLYEKALRDLTEEDLREDLEEFLEQTKHHVELCEEMLEQAGGSPDESSPAAEAAEQKAEGLLSVEVPDELVDFNNIENLVLAETKDHWNWERLSELSGSIKDRDLKSVITQAVREVLKQEQTHLDWNSETLTELAHKMMIEPEEGEEAEDEEEMEMERETE